MTRGILLCGLFLLASPWLAMADIARVKIDSSRLSLKIEALQDGLFHFELSPSLPGSDAAAPIHTSLQIQKKDYSGPTEFTRNGTTLETSRLRVDVNSSDLCISVTDKIKGARLTRFCPLNFSQEWKGLTFSKDSTTHLYGLGEQFNEPGNANGDWVGKVRSPGGQFGNDMVSFNGGFTGNAQFPILYAVGPRDLSYAVFLDSLYKQNWDFQGDPWKVETWGETLRWYVIAGNDLPALRTQYMDLVGHPLVPPKKAFGLWVSQYGYSNWTEIDDHLASLRRNGFPVDGFVLDLQWFGGVTPNSDNSRMGTLQFDELNFPHPKEKIADYAAKGIGLITIEESYVSRGLPEFNLLQGKGFLAKDCPTCGATYITRNPWWGKGGLIDWTNPAASVFWHDLKRQPLVDLGIMGHWTDLGEPEMYNEWAWYYGFPELQKFRQADIHNVFNLKWHEGIVDGYLRNQVRKRPFLLSRSGTSGIQRYGAALWSGDIGSNLSSLATHFNAQMHLSFSGIDYFGADIGGFHRGALTGDLNETYTQWFANGASFDVPVRPHTENLCKCKQTSPDRIGDLTSNLANIRLRYELIPYYYSLAHRAHLFGEPVLPPLVYYYQNDPNVRGMGAQKLLGRDVLIAVVAGNGEKQRDVYLPEGEWFDYYTNARYQSRGEWVRNVPEYRNGVFRLPVFIRAGAILPKMYVDEQTLDAFGHRADGSIRDELILRVYGNGQAGSFTLYEDDGQTVDYLQGKTRTTEISQGRSDSSLWVKVEGSKGTYDGAPANREVVLEWVGNSNVQSIQLNGVPLEEVSWFALKAGKKSLKTGAAGSWAKDPATGVIRAHAGKLSVQQRKVFELTLVRK